MAESGKRLRQMAAKAARRKAIVAAKNKSDGTSRSRTERIRLAVTCPIARCVVAAELFETGIGHLILARSLPSGLLGCGFFLVDPFCLGVKDAFYAEMGRDDLQSRMDDLAEFQTFVDVAPAWARKLVHEAVAYAAGLGLPAPKDYGVVESIFGSVDADACTESFTFGKNDKPYYITGPLDTPARIRSVCQTLQDRFGTGGWNFLMEVPNE